MSSWILTCVANRDIIQMWRTHTRSRSAAYGSAAVRFARRSALHVLLLDDTTPPMNVFSLQSCEAWNWFDVESNSISNWMLTCAPLCFQDIIQM